MAMNTIEASDSTPAIAVLIPTYNRVAQLRITLDHLRAQTWMDFEVVIIDDGSTDGTVAAVEQYRQGAPFPIMLQSQRNSGPAAARNRGITLVRAPVTVLLGDDTYPVPDFVRLHLQYQREHPELESVAVGYTRYSEEHQRVTPFMRWLNSDGVQFAYGELLAGAVPSWRHFYTSNLSFKTEYLRRHPFEEGFRHYGMEDIELGYRLHKLHGLRMSFLPDAIEDHVHPFTFSQVCSRSLRVGENIYKLGQIWPEHRDLPALGRVERLGIRALTSRWMWPLVAGVMNRMTAVWFPGRLIHAFIGYYREQGYRRAEKADRAAAVC